MVCEQYRIGLMALLDGEATESEQDHVRDHLSVCSHCHEAYEGFLHVQELTLSIIPQSLTLSPATLPRDFSWDNYYSGVCRKMRNNGSYTAWSLVSLSLAIAGSLMIFGFSSNPLAILAGSIAFAAAGGVMFLSYFCNCQK